MASKSRRKLRVLFATSEAAPFAKTGGLGDVGGSLPQALKAAGVRASVIMPKYASIPSQYLEKMEHVADFYMPLAWRNVFCGIEKLTHDGIDFYFVDNEDYFYREAPYGYFDDGERFAFFAKAIVEAIEYVPELECDILHCNDWQTALAPVFLREFYQGDGRHENIRTVFTVHNVKFQGQYSDFVLGDILGLHDVPAAAEQLRIDDHSINYMRGALCYSDSITTVSPTYAEELKMPFFGEGLDGEFRRRSDIVRGVLNGIDLREWNAQTDLFIAQNYSQEDMSGKAACKQALQAELGLPEDPERPVLGMVTRLTAQKGLDLVNYAMDTLVERGFHVVVLGTGDRNFEDSMRYFEWRYPEAVRACILFDNEFAHRVYAGSDLFLMPSQFEPCGLSQMISMRYGTLPVVRETGGLADSVSAYNQFTGEGNGFSFANFNADEMASVLMLAADLFENDSATWNKLMRQAMATDFSWKRSAEAYLDIYFGLHGDIARPSVRDGSDA